MSVPVSEPTGLRTDLVLCKECGVLVRIDRLQRHISRLHPPPKRIRNKGAKKMPATKGPASTAELIGRTWETVAPTQKVVMSDGTVLVGGELAVVGLSFSSRKRRGKKPKN